MTTSATTPPSPSRRPTDQDPPLPAWRVTRPRSLPRPVDGGAPALGFLLLPPAYALLLGAAELLATASQADFPAIGPACFAAVLALLGSHVALYWPLPRRYVPLAAAAAPALRLLLFLTPDSGGPLIRGLALGLPLASAGLAALLPIVLRRPKTTGKKRTWTTERQAPRILEGSSRTVSDIPLGSSPQAPSTFPSAGLRKGVRARLLPLPIRRAPGWSRAVWNRWQAACSRGWKLYSASLARRCRDLLRRRPAGMGRPAFFLPALTLSLALFAGLWVVHAGAPRQAAGDSLSAAIGERAIARGAWPPGVPARPPASAPSLNTAEKTADSNARRGRLPRRPPPNASASRARPTLPQLPPEELAAMASAAAPPPPAAPEAPAFPNCPSLGLWNPYPRAVCTWYAKERRPDLPGFIGDWGLAVNWPAAAERCGFRVDGVPRAGAVIVFPPGANGAYEGGHVAYVEEVQPGALLISECNADQSSAFAVRPQWWDSGYSCTFRRIPWEWLSPNVIYIHGFQEPAGPPTPWSPTPRDGVDNSPAAP